MNQFRIVAVVAAVLLTLASYGEDCKHTVSVNGKAEETIKPDTAYLTVYALATGVLMVDAVKKADELVAEITAAIMSESNVVGTITVEDISIGEKMKEYWSSDQKDAPPRPQVARRIRATCAPKPDGIYQVIDKAIRAGALMQVPSRINYSDDLRGVVVYGLEQCDEVVERVGRAAMADAKAKAEKAARLAGKQAGDVVSIGCAGPMSMCTTMRMMGMQTQFPTEYVGTNPEGITISQSLTVTFALE